MIKYRLGKIKNASISSFEFYEMYKMQIRIFMKKMSHGDLLFFVCHTCGIILFFYQKRI